MANPFDVLGVSREASADEIKTAFRNKAKECHPDRHPDDPNATARFAELSDAYDKLKDGKSATYGEQPQNHGFGFGFGFDQDGLHPFEAMMRNMEQQARRQRGRNDDISIMHSVTLEDAFKGTKATIELNHRRGFTKTDINIPAGVMTGVRLCANGGGMDTDPTLPNGNLYVIIHVMPHKTFGCEGSNLILIKEIDVFTAILGGSFDVETIDGKTISVTVPKFVNSGQQLRVAGRGMPDLSKKGRFGDLIVVLDVKMTTHLLPEQIALIEQARVLGAGA